MPEQNGNRLFLVDGHALIFRMYYALLRRPMVNSKGEDTSILFGFTKYILELIEREHPSHFAVAFDPPGKTFRHEMYPEYKGTRAATPQLVIDALEPLCKICKALRIPVLMMPGFEADDVIGSAAKRAGREGYEVYLVTPDKDYGQLIEEHIIQYKPGKGGSERELVGVREICEKYGISHPEQVVDMLAICGDASDNVPGVKGIGEVGAGKLISKYGSVSKIYEHLDELSPKQKAMFEAAADHIGLSRTLVTIKTDIEIGIPTSQMALAECFDPEILRILEHYEMGSLKRFIRRVDTVSEFESEGEQAAMEAPRHELSVRSVSVGELYAAARREGICAIVCEGEGDSVFSRVKRLSVAVADCEHGGLAAEGQAKDFAELLSDAGIAKTGCNLKLQTEQLAASGIALEGRLFDLEVMHYLINPERSHRLDMLSRGYLGIEIEAPEEEPDQPAELSLFDSVETSEPKSRQREAVITALLLGKVSEELSGCGMKDLYEKMEEPLIRVLAKMETSGVKMDLAQLKNFTRELQDEVLERQDRIRRMVEEPELNISSPKQIGILLFEKLKLDPKQKKSPNGSYPTDEETLNSLSGKHPIIAEILEYRAAKKLLSTYIEPFPGYVSPTDGRIHTTFNQALTATGRLSSSKPNLQNIPIRTERGREIRKTFVPSTPDGLIVSADYSQIELRIMAHLSCDAHLIAAFNAGQDVHAATAARIFGVEASEVTSEQRRVAKTANFGIMYGISAFGLSQRLGNSRSEAKKIIEDYFASFPAISSFIEDTLAGARENGYVETLFGRRRYTPDINSRNANVRALAERNAVNAPIQGTSADIIKLAMVGIDRRMSEAGLKSRMVLQIHDELLFDAVPEELETLKQIVVDEMENVIRLSIPLTVECNEGKNWLEAH